MRLSINIHYDFLNVMHVWFKVRHKCYDRKTTLSCKSVCKVRLPCGHACTLLCHIHKDPAHLKYKCEKNCARLCKEGNSV